MWTDTRFPDRATLIVSLLERETALEVFGREIIPAAAAFQPSPYRFSRGGRG